MHRLFWELLLAALLTTVGHAQSGAESAGYAYKCTLNGALVQFTNAKCPDSAQREPIAEDEVSTANVLRPTAATAPESDLTSHGHYVNHAGETGHSPSTTVSGAVPAGASAVCGDGSYSFSRNPGGTCSHHGGVAKWL